MELTATNADLRLENEETASTTSRLEDYELLTAAARTRRAASSNSAFFTDAEASATGISEEYCFEGNEKREQESSFSPFASEAFVNTVRSSNGKLKKFSSKYFGVSFTKNCGKWASVVPFFDKTTGKKKLFRDEIEAAEHYDNMVNNGS